MKRKLLHDISANTLQVVINQLCGAVIFYVLSLAVDKTVFGEINWSLAVLLTGFSILSCGIDQVVIKRIAAGNNGPETLSLYIFHVIFTGLLFYGLILTSRFLFPSFFQQHSLLLLIGIGKLMIFFSTPFKQAANGMEKFRPLFYMAVCSNIVRSTALILTFVFHTLDLDTIIIIFIAGDVTELLVSLFISSTILKIPLTFSFDKKKYIALFRESLPLAGVVVFSATMARFDWIFLGIFTNNIVLANYSFAYKVFEMASLPLLVIAPILIPKFTRHFQEGAITAEKKQLVKVLIRIEMIIASLTALLLNIFWVPVIDGITKGKYGSINSNTILILSACLPLLYFNNILWVNSFAKGRFKTIFRMITFTFIVNIAGDIILIPFYKAEGAAVAFLAALLVQSVLYLRHSKKEIDVKSCAAVLLCPLLAIASGSISIYLFKELWMIAAFAFSVFVFLLLITKQLRTADWYLFKQLLGF